ncbi:MAG: MBL fold metallo-hydrolase [Microgenomates group bacterium]|jgi:metallo-beta-lactamase family protein
MQKVQFFGAAGGVTGSCNLLIGEHTQILIDLGMFQGIDDKNGINASPLAFDVTAISAVLVTHAHLDHCGRLPLLIKNGFKGKVYTTQATKDIVAVSLLDSAGIAQENGLLLYTPQDVEELVSLIEVVDYNQPFKVGEYDINFKNAGHILGSASIEISNNETIVFSGDLGNTPEDLIPATEYISKADFVVMESTYGDSSHPEGDASQTIQNEINEVEKNGGVLLIPAFAIERTQEVLHIIGHLKQKGLVKNETPVYLDSPLALEVTEIFKKYPNLYNQSTFKESSPFDFSNLNIIETFKQSKSIIKDRGPKIIIAGSGMLTGGRILQHLKNYISLPTTRLLMVGYQAVNTLGRELEEGAKQIAINEAVLSVRAVVTKIDSLSSHADLPKLLTWLKHIQGIKKVFINHGEINQRNSLAEKIKTETEIKNVELPEMNQIFELV